MNGKGVVERRQVQGVEIAANRRYIAKSGQFIISRIDARNGASGLVPDELDGAVVTNDFPLFDVAEDRLDARFLGWMSKTRSFVQLCKRASEGTTNRVRLSEDRFIALSILLPPLDEQRHIVARIEELAAKVEEAKRLRSAALDEHNAILGQSLSAVFGSHSANWSTATVGDIAQSLDAGWSPQCEETPASSDQWGVLKTTAVQWCEFRPNENKRLPSSEIGRPELTVKAGDVLVTRAGPLKRVGVPATAREDYQNLMISDKLIRIRPKLDAINPRFLEYALSSPQAQEHLVARKTGLADAQVNISQAILRATPLSYPSLVEQTRVVSELDALQVKVNAVKALQTATAAELDAMLPAILDKAFKGEL
jgi:type I restriction enzyme S subunit